MAFWNFLPCNGPLDWIILQLSDYQNPEYQTGELGIRYRIKNLNNRTIKYRIIKKHILVWTAMHIYIYVYIYIRYSFAFWNCYLQNQTDLSQHFKSNRMVWFGWNPTPEKKEKTGCFFAACGSWNLMEAGRNSFPQILHFTAVVLYGAGSWFLYSIQEWSSSTVQ